MLGSEPGDIDEKHLIIDLDPVSLRDTIKTLYNLEYLTFERLKLVLKQGAKASNLMRMSDENFDELVRVLELPLEKIQHQERIY